MELSGQVESQRRWAWPRRAVGALPGEVVLRCVALGAVGVLLVAMFPSVAGTRPRACEASASERRKWVEVGVGALPEFGLSLNRATSVLGLPQPGSNRSHSRQDSITSITHCISSYIGFSLPTLFASPPESQDLCVV